VGMYMLQGVLLTHRALVAVIAATKAFIDQISPNIANGESIDQRDVILSYLPLVR
jgi:long-subunit acyl-CoA synthetase (AMP-forming)